MEAHEITELVRLLDKMAWSPNNNVPPEAFFAICRTTVLPCVDLALIRVRSGSCEVMLTKRPSHDPFFANLWHIPGGVVVPGATALTTIRERVMRPDFGTLLIREPTFVMERDILKGPPDREHSPRGQEVYRLFQYVLEPSEAEPSENDMRKFFPLDAVPDELIAHQVPNIEKLCEVHRVARL